MQDSERARQGAEWQTAVWNRISDIYLREIDQRFAPVVDAVMARAQLTAGERVLDLGTGTGVVAERASSIVGADGQVIGVDISPDMIALAQARMEAGGVTNVTLREGSGESIPAEDHSVDVILSSLTLMYIIDRAAAAREIARVLKAGGRFIASVCASADRTTTRGSKSSHGHNVFGR